MNTLDAAGPNHVESPPALLQSALEQLRLEGASDLL